MGVSVSKRLANENVYKIDTHINVCLKMRSIAVKSKGSKIDVRNSEICGQEEALSMKGVDTPACVF